MGLLKWLCKKFNCKSECQFNGEQYYDDTKLNHKLSMYRLKHKDIQTIQRILEKRELKSESPEVMKSITNL